MRAKPRVVTGLGGRDVAEKVVGLIAMCGANPTFQNRTRIRGLIRRYETTGTIKIASASL
jgi:hypothetical protein